MKKILLCFLFVTSFSLGFSQDNSKLDSLKKVLASLPAEGKSFAGDTMRVRVLCQMGLVAKMKTAIKFYEEAVALSNEKLNKEAAIKIKYQFVKFYKKKGFYFQAIPKLFELLRYAETKVGNNFKAVIYRDLADCYLMLESFENAEKYYQLAIDEFRNDKNYSELVDTQNNLGLVYYNKKDYRTAIAEFEKCQKYESQVKGTIYEASYLSNLGSSYRELKDFSNAKKYFNEALKTYEQLDKKYYPFLSMTLTEYAKLFEESGNLDQAFVLAKRAEKVDNTNYGNDVSTNEILERLYFKKGNWLMSHRYLKNYLLAKEKNIERTQKEQVESLKNEYDLSQQINKNILLQKDIDRELFIRKVFVVGIFLSLLFVCYIVYLNKKLKQNQNDIESKSTSLLKAKNQLEHVNSNLEEIVLERTTELTIANENLIQKNEEILSAMMNGQKIERKRVAAQLHDNLGSTISALKWRLGTLDTSHLSKKEIEVYESIKQMMGSAYKEIRNISHNLIPKGFENNGLLNSLHNLIGDLNNGSTCHIKINADSAIKFPSLKIEFELYAVLLELINNLIKHSNASNAIIEIDKLNTTYKISIEDDGIGMRFKNETGMGISNIKERLSSINARLILKDSQSGTKWEIILEELG
jgi:signal transduction histidine kinase